MRTNRARIVGLVALSLASVVPSLAHAEPVTPQDDAGSGSLPAAPPAASPPLPPAPPPPASSAAPAPPPGGHWVYVEDKTASAPPSPPAAAPVPTSMRGLYERSVTWDANIDGAFGRYFGDPAKWTGFARARAGVLFVREPLYEAIGFTYEYSPVSAATFGIQAELLDLDLGLWAQAGGLLDIHARPGGMLALGWSLFGVEAQYRSFEGYGQGFAVYAKIRVPISILTRIFRARHASTKTAAASELLSW